jgi:alkylhydroperoxidase family enzyme
MPWIDAPHEDGWDGSFDELRAQVTDPTFQRVDWIMRIHALDAGSMKAHYVLYRQAMKGTATLRKVEREMVALVVSKTNDCHY